MLQIFLSRTFNFFDFFDFFYVCIWKEEKKNSKNKYDTRMLATPVNTSQLRRLWIILCCVICNIITINICIFGLGILFTWKLRTILLNEKDSFEKQKEKDILHGNLLVFLGRLVFCLDAHRTILEDVLKVIAYTVWAFEKKVLWNWSKMLVYSKWMNKLQFD